MSVSLDDPGKRLLRVLAAVCILAVATLATACSYVYTGSRGTPTPQDERCPVPSPSLLPAAWKAVDRGTLVNIDQDDDKECLIIYRYNVTGENQGPLGGVILDTQASSTHLSDLLVYRLLPWVNQSYAITNTVPGSTPGYLGALGEQSVEVRLYDSDNDGKADELGLLGSDAAGNKTTLSLYRWTGPQGGYSLLGYFHGNARVDISDVLEFDKGARFWRGAVRTVTAVDRMFDRSGLAMVYQYVRNANGVRFDYWANWVAFVDGRPANACYYPEGQALVRYNDLNRPVFDLRVISEDDGAGKATVCTGSWDLSSNQWRRYWTLLELEKQRAASVSACDQWIVKRELIEPGRISCSP